MEMRYTLGRYPDEYTSEPGWYWPIMIEIYNKHARVEEKTFLLVE